MEEMVSQFRTEIGGVEIELFYYPNAPYRRRYRVEERAKLAYVEPIVVDKGERRAHLDAAKELGGIIMRLTDAQRRVTWPRR